MPQGHLESFIRTLRRWAGTGCAMGLTVGQLLERFLVSGKIWIRKSLRSRSAVASRLNEKAGVGVKRPEAFSGGGFPVLGGAARGGG